MSQTHKPQIDETTFHKHVTRGFFFQSRLKEGKLNLYARNSYFCQEMLFNLCKYRLVNLASKAIKFSYTKHIIV